MRHVRFSPYLLVVALSPVFLQTNTPLSCTSGDTTLSEFSLYVQGVDRIVGFDSSQMSYSASLPLGTDEAMVHAVSTDPAAQVWVDVVIEGERSRYLHGGVGGGDLVVPLPLGSSVLEVWVRAPKGATDYYGVSVVVAPTEFIAGDPVTLSGASPFSQCTEDSAPTHTFAADSEVEPWIAINPIDPNHLAAVWQQDRYLSSGGARGHAVAVSFDAGSNWVPVTIPGLTPCSGGDWDRTTDPWLTFAANGDLYAAAMS